MPTPEEIKNGPWLVELARLEAESAQRIADAYKRTLALIEEKQTVLLNTVGEDNSLSPKFGKTLLDYKDTIEAELNAFGLYARDEVVDAVGRTVIIGQDAAVGMAQASVRDARFVVANWRRTNPQAILQAIGYADSNALAVMLDRLGTKYASSISDFILTNVAQGRNPSVWAKELASVLMIPYQDADSIARTVQIYSYRDATHYEYQQNKNIVSGWMWYSSLDERTCIACVALHGTIHPVEEKLNDHWRGRCVALPIVRGATWQNDVKRGDEYFAALDERKQRGHFGNNRLYEAWKRGDVALDDVVKTSQDPIFGVMRRVASAKEMGFTE